MPFAPPPPTPAAGLSATIGAVVRHRLAPVMAIVTTAIVGFGYEIFNFNLSLDDTFAGTRNTRSWAETLLGQGRWAEALLVSALPNAVGPVVTLSLGVALIATAFVWLARYQLAMSPWVTAAGVALAVSAPVTALVMTFSS